ncbi:MAG: cupin domain-containing protein [Filomicrobium sp.]
MTNDMTADEIITLLQLEPHPEGGYFKETFRDEVSNADGRAASTAIYFLLKAGQTSRWHKVDAAETWHWYAGAALELRIASPSGSARRIRLGSELATGERPQAIVPPGHWQQARTLGDYTLVGCTVAPGFLFEKFELAEPGFEPGE